MPSVLYNMIPRLSCPEEYPGEQAPRSGLVTTTRDYLGNKSEEGAPASLSLVTMPCTLTGYLELQPSYSPMVSALLKWQLSTLVGSLFSQSFNSSKYTSTLQCLTNRPCSTTCEREARVKEQWFHTREVLEATRLISGKRQNSHDNQFP